jgi:hypothetical protein
MCPNYLNHLSESLELHLFTLPQRLPQENVVLFISGFVIAFSFSELLLEFRKTLLIAFLSAILSAWNLLFQSSADAVPLDKSRIIISQFLERQASRSQLLGQRSGEWSRDII